MFDWSVCTTVSDLLDLIHSSFTTFDHIVGAPRANMPRDPYTRNYLQPALFQKLVNALESGAFSARKIEDWIKKYPEVFVFLYKLRTKLELYSDGFHNMHPAGKSNRLRQLLVRPNSVLTLTETLTPNSIKFNWIGNAPKTLRAVRALH